MINNALATSRRMRHQNGIRPGDVPSCFFCGDGEDSLTHVLSECAVVCEARLRFLGLLGLSPGPFTLPSLTLPAVSDQVVLAPDPPIPPTRTQRHTSKVRTRDKKGIISKPITYFFKSNQHSNTDRYGSPSEPIVVSAPTVPDVPTHPQGNSHKHTNLCASYIIGVPTPYVLPTLCFNFATWKFRHSPHVTTGTGPGWRTVSQTLRETFTPPAPKRSHATNTQQ